MRVRLIVPILALALSGAVVVVPFAVSADGAASVTIHEGSDPATWGYTPTSTSVTVGQTITWTNAGAVPHDAASTDGTWKTPLLNNGASASVTFNTPGTYNYICTPHPWMKGTVVVTAAAAAPAPAAPAAPAADTSSSTDTGVTAPAPPAPASNASSSADMTPQPADSNPSPDTDTGSGS